ncbi:SDR family NAD(P)-dependent oxidoreductase [Chloroflexus sp.]|uniref:SDR family NAD(P)-dependent oxidoreductase n=1 Tax=Chloroflexus sp. TaxID=1904827 RepID=UPI002ACEBF88|nr:SDR family NAD(P)-dependent oxidoreductase [Chloroflexus sp.]
MAITQPRVWLVTGAGGGFGLRLVRRLIERGECVAAADRQLELMAALPAAEPAQLLRLAMDLTDPAAIRHGVAAALAHFGRIDVLVNNAGLGHGGPLEEATIDDIRRLFDVNIIGMMLVTQAVLPAMRAAGSGHIINLSSDSGVIGFPFQGVYTATKHAVEGFSDSLYQEVTPFGIRVSVIQPCGMFKTAMPANAIAAARATLRPDSPYAARALRMAATMAAAWEHASDPDEVALAILEVAAADPPPIRRRVGPAERTGLLGLRQRMSHDELVQFIAQLTSGTKPPPLPKARADGGWLVARTLREAGVTHAFTIVGGHNYHLVNACREEGISVIDARNEMHAAHMADAFARFTRQPALLTVDAAPGLVNAIAGIEVAYEAQVPMIIATAQGSLAGRDIGVMQAIDQLRLLRPITKWQRTCFETKRLPEYTAAALRYATTGRPGPAFLDFPLEVMQAMIDVETAPIPRHYRVSSGPLADPVLLRRALDLLRKARRPLMIAGSGVWWAHGEAELRRFVEATGIPVLTRNLARGLIPDDHPLAAGFYPSPAALADAFLVIGTRLDWTIGYGRPPLFSPEAPVAQIDIHPESIGKTRPIEIGIVADAAQALRQLNALLASAEPWAMEEGWPAMAHGSIAAMRAETAAAARLSERANRPIHSIELMQALADCLPRDAIKIVDGGYSAAFAIQYLDAYVPGGVTWVGSTGHLGVGLGFAIGAKLARPAAPVVAIMGDGAFGLCGMEFDTAVRHRLPIIVVIANDAGWGETRDGQRRRWGEQAVVGTALNPSRYDELARALGGYGEQVTHIDQLAPAIRRAFASGMPAIINVITDPDQRSSAVSGLPWIVE